MRTRGESWVGGGGTREECRGNVFEEDEEVRGEPGWYEIMAIECGCHFIRKEGVSGNILWCDRGQHSGTHWI